ncbi:MAG: fibronectin type III domain-containing protein, partial [Lewinella sp.]
MLYPSVQPITTKLSRYVKHQLPIQLSLLVTLLCFASTAYAQTSATGYRYVRFVADDVYAGSLVREVTFLNGEVTYPRLPMESNAGTVEAKFYGSAPYNGYLLFDQSASAELYVADPSDGQREYTLEFIGRPVYVTGVRIKRPSWSALTSFRVEGSNDPTVGWTNIYTSPANMDNSYFSPSATDADFLFGTDPVTIDTVAPASPAPAVASLSQSSVTVSWPAAEDASGRIAGYSVFFDGINQGFTETTSFTQGDLQPSTSYEVEVVAYDSEFNPSAPGTLTITTEDPPVADGYTYLRFTALGDAGDSRQLVNIDWMMGDRALPFDALTTADGSGAVTISSSNENIYNFDGPWKAFDDANDTHWYVAPGKDVTLRFNDVTVYPTGIAIGTYTWQTIQGFRCEASNDGVNWTLLEEREGLTGSDYGRENGLGVARFDFNLALPDDFDSSPPAVPTDVSIYDVDATTA